MPIEKHILNKNDTRAFLEATCLDFSSSDLTINTIIEDAQSWQKEVHCLSLFAAIFLERQSHEGGNCQPLVDRIYGLEDKMCFSMNECDPDFVEYLLRNIRESGLPMEEILTDILTRYSNYDRSKTIRM